MTMAPREMLLGVFVLASGNHVAGWRIPGAFTSNEDFEAIVQIAQDAEEAKLDFLFFADSPCCVLDDHPSFVLKLEPTTLLGALAGRTSRIGLVATISTTFSEPYNIARVFASLDRISQGRIGMNVVTSGTEQVAANFGRSIPPHDTRYVIASEYVDVVQGLWDSWEDGALLADRNSGQYVDRSKVHLLDHKGEHYTVRGPLAASRSPQGQPVIVQAGASESGERFAARYAEMIFTVQQDIGEAQRFYSRIGERAAALGRAADEFRILPGLVPIVGRTEEEWKAKFARLSSLVEPGSALELMSQRCGHDMSRFDMKAPVPDLPLSEGVHSFVKILFAKAQRDNMTLKDLHDLFAISRGYLILCGTPASIADAMEEWVVGKACDGFMLLPPDFPEALRDFNKLVVPELQRRALFRHDYAGTTLRENLGLAIPANRHSPATR